MRKLIVTGRLAANAERKVSNSGREFIKFRIANNEYGDDKNEHGYIKPYWYSVICTNPSYIGMSQYLTKGKPIIVIGRYSDSIYQNRSGQCDISRDILADSIEFMPYDNNEQHSTTTNQQTSQAPTIQTQMANNADNNAQNVASPLPTTADIKIPQSTSVIVDSEDDDLPF